jgi:type IV pilus assembly protein PilC
MPRFTYSARTRSGERVENTLEAADRRAALSALERQGLIPVSLAEADAVPAAKARRFSLEFRRDRMRTRELLVFTTELSDLLASGMTLGNALNALAVRKTGSAADTIVAGLRDAIVRGASLSDAMARHPDTFSRLYVSMIRAGEASGALHEVLRRLVRHYERVQEAKEKVVMALVYPLIVFLLGVVTMLFSTFYVIPKFKDVFDQMGGSLPLPTRIVMDSSTILARYGWAIGIVIAFLVIMLNRAIKTRRGRYMWHTMQLKAPLIRGVIASGTYANFARTLGTLMANGVPVLQALGIGEQTVGNDVIANEIHKARDRVTDGTTISGPLAAGKVFPRIMIDMLSIGEQTGNLPDALEHIGARYESELDRNVKIFTTALEPIMIVVIAVAVGFVAVSILMAVFSLTSGLNV